MKTFRLFWRTMKFGPSFIRLLNVAIRLLGVDWGWGQNDTLVDPLYLFSKGKTAHSYACTVMAPLTRISPYQLYEALTTPLLQQI